MGKKECFKCGKEKDLSMFYKHKQMGDGYLGKCKECTKLDVTEHRDKNIDKIRAYDRQRAKLPHRAERARLYGIEYRKKNPFKRRAHNELNNALRSNKIVKPDTCSDCGCKPSMIFGHHEDYSKPLEVIWLCQPCHKSRHRK